MIFRGDGVVAATAEPLKARLTWSRRAGSRLRRPGASPAP